MRSATATLDEHLGATPVPRHANTVTKTAVGMVELLPSLLLNLASGPQIAVMNTATHMAVIASDAHISGTSRNDHRSRSAGGSCEIVDISHLLSGTSVAPGRSRSVRASPDGALR